jgi:hypothetical protein
VLKPVRQTLETPNLSNDLRATLRAVDRQAGRLHSLEKLDAVLKDKIGLDAVPVVNKHLDNLVEAGDSRLAALVREFLAFRAKLNGRLDVAKQLFPAGKFEGKPLQRLRDMNRILAEEAGGSIKGIGSGKVQGPIPEASAGGTRPKPKESAKADLPPLNKETAAADEQFRARLNKVMKERTKIHQDYFNQNLSHLKYFSARALAKAKGREEDDKKPKIKWVEKPPATVARLLGRHLTPLEQALVRRFQRRGKPPAKTAALFLKLDKLAGRPSKKDSKEPPVKLLDQAIATVARALARSLTPAERTLVRIHLRKGDRPEEIARSFRAIEKEGRAGTVPTRGRRGR